jgi:AcrR family transcriptional regulator
MDIHTDGMLSGKSVSMARIVKQSESRRDELIVAARELIYTIGYEATTVEKIHQHLGLSKGAFYHYFSAKQEIADAVIEREIFENLEELEKVVDDPNANSGARLGMFFRFMRNWKVANFGSIINYLRIFYSDGNVFFRHLSREYVIEAASPALASIISAGVKNGFFRTTASEQLTDFAIRVGFDFNDRIAELLIEMSDGIDNYKKIENTILIYQNSLEKVLGAPGGSIRIINKEFIKSCKPEL